MSSAFYPYEAVLLDDGGGGITYTGPTYAVNGGRDPGQAIKAAFNMTQAGAGSLNARVEGTWDEGTTWLTLASMTALAAAGAAAELVTVSAAAPQVRVVVTPGGGATFTAAHVALISTAGLGLELV